MSEQPRAPGFREALRFWLKLGFISFGGPAAQIAIMHRELVETKRWMDERHFLHGLNFCMLLPGPEAQQLATYLGWRLHGAKGGIAAGALFVLPSVFVLYALSWLFIAGEELAWVAAIFHGLLGTVIALVLDAVIRIGKKTLRSPFLIAVAAIAFVAIYHFNVNFVVLMGSAALAGFLVRRWWPRQLPAGRSHGSGGQAAAAVELPPPAPATWGRSLRVAAITLSLWWAPVIVTGTVLGWGSTPAQLGLFFSKAALLTFGGAYAVLPYVAQRAVEIYGWLDHTQMMAGLALAESTPGPLIMVLQFVGFVAGWQHPGALDPWVVALIGSAITTWVTFLPSFLFVLFAAPWVEKLGDFPALSAALTAITACVVGVVLNLGVKFALAALWQAGESVDLFVAVVACASFLALAAFRLPLLSVIAAAAAAGLAWHFVNP